MKPKRGRATGSKPKTTGLKPNAPKTVNDSEKNIDTPPERPSAVNKTTTQSLPVWLTRVVDPAGPDRPWPKCASAEVKAAAVRKAQLQQELRELNEQKIQTLAEMDVQEEFIDKEEEHLRASRIANTATMDGVDDADIESPGGEQESSDSEIVVDDEEAQVSDSEVVQAATSAPGKKPSVRSWF